MNHQRNGAASPSTDATSTLSSGSATKVDAAVNEGAGRPRAPFVIGVTGNMDPVGYSDDKVVCDSSSQMQTLRKTVFDLLDWVRGPLELSADQKPTQSYLNPKRRSIELGKNCPADSDAEYHSCWKSLDLKLTPIVLLTSLAPGIDTIVAEAFLDYAAERNDHDIFVRCPLPFPVIDANGDNLYRRASTFNTPERQLRFDQLLERVRRQPGFLEDRDLFEVALDEDHSGDAQQDLTAIDQASGKARRHLRYRAAGESVASISHLLLAFFDKSFDKANPQDLYEAGSATIVETKCAGMTHELLAMSNNFTWADNGPVLVVPTHRSKNTGIAPNSTLYFRHPLDTSLNDAGWDAGHRGTQDPEWQKSGDDLFRRMLKQQETFNCLAASTGEGNELIGMTAGRDRAAFALIEQSPQMNAVVAPLDTIARIRRRAADEVKSLDGERKATLMTLLWLIFAAAICLTAYEQWHSDTASPPHDKSSADPSSGTRQSSDIDAGNSTSTANSITAASSSPGATVTSSEPIALHDSSVTVRHWIRGLFLFSTLVSIGWIALEFFCYQWSRKEQRRYDYRTISEALRVQFYWMLTGTGRSVSAESMQRQRDELAWIRNVVAALAAPLEVTRRRFLNCQRQQQVQLLHCAVEFWVAVQRHSFVKTYRKRRDDAHTFHRQGWSLLLAGLLALVFHLLAHVIEPLHHLIEHNWIVLSLLLISGGFAIWALFPETHGDNHAPSVDDEDHSEKPGLRQFGKWLWSDPIIVAMSLVISGVAIFVSFLMGGRLAWLPDAHHVWSLLTGVMFVGGALCIAWMERTFLNEEARQYGAMASLFRSAHLRLEDLISRYAIAADGSVESDRLLIEIHDIFYQLGCEALDENAEWLIQRRARPLEPFLAG